MSLCTKLIHCDLKCLCSTRLLFCTDIQLAVAGTKDGRSRSTLSYMFPPIIHADLKKNPKVVCNYLSLEPSSALHKNTDMHG